MPKSSKFKSRLARTSAPTAFYAVHIGRCPGVYTSWTEVQTQVNGFERARHRKFASSAAAEHFVLTGIAPDSSKVPASQSKSSFRPSPNANTGQDKKVNKLEVVDKNTIRAYCDGACSGNGQKNVLTPAGSGVWWEPNAECPVSLPPNLAIRLPGPLQTNNRAELYAIYLVLKHDPDPNLKLEIYTDSQYSINCLTKWLSSWLRNDWKTASGKPVENRDLIDAVRKLLSERDRVNRNGCKFIYVRGHAGNVGNEEADRLARLGAEKAAVLDLALS